MLSLSSTSDFDCNIRVDSINSEYAIMELTTASTRFDKIVVAFEYRIWLDWLEDAYLATSESKDNRIVVLCNQTTYFRWYYPNNRLTRGSPCDIRIRVVPQIIGLLGSRTILESVSPDNREVGSISSSKIINLGFVRKQICVDLANFIINDRTGSLLFSVPISLPVWAQEKQSGNFIVLTDGGHLLEFDPNSLPTPVRDVDYSSYLTNPKYFLFDESSETILVAGYNNPYVYEVAWGTIYGGAPVRTSAAMTKPISAAYFSGHDDILIIDRAPVPCLVTANWISGITDTTSQISINGADVSLSSPFIPFIMADGTIIIIEQFGETQQYSTEGSQHPALVRAGIASGSGKDLLPEYSGLTFAPLIRNPK